MQYALIDQRLDWYAVTDDPQFLIPIGHIMIPVADAVTYSRSYREQVVPDVITRTQGRLILHRAGMLSAVEAAVAASGVEAAIVYESPIWRRANILIQSLGAAVGLSPTQIDDLFISAGAIDP